MKIALLILIFAISPFWLFSDEKTKDTKYSRGKIYLLNNDTVDVYVKSEPVYDMQGGIHYLDSTGTAFSLLPSKAKGFSLLYKNDTMNFESRKDLKMVLFTSKKSKSNFIYWVSNGSLPLYYFVEKQLVMDGIDQVKVDVPRYMVLVDQDWFSITSKSYAADFTRLISNLKEVYNNEQMKALLTEVADGKYKFDDTPLVIARLTKIPAFKN